MKTKTMITCALFAAVICVFSVITVPTGIVPVTLGLFGIMITAVILGPAKAAVSTAVFILLGAVGLPVFSGFKGGVGVLAGPTGGYIWSYVIMAVIIGSAASRQYEKKLTALAAIFASCLISVVICYVLGTLQFMLVQKTNLQTALTLCVLPFIPFDIVKAAAASYAGYTVKQRLIRAHLI